MSDEELSRLDAVTDRAERAFLKAAEAARVVASASLSGESELGVPTVADLAATGLPFNRKERFFTGTVLPMIVACDDMLYLNRFTALCGLATASFDDAAAASVQVFTEYGFVESLVGEAAERFGTVITSKDTPDVVIFFAGDQPGLLAVEAKFVPAAPLSRQLHCTKL